MLLTDCFEEEKKVVIFTGSPGTGKTEISINFSLAWSLMKKGINLIDLDIVKPYFRSREIKDRFRSFSIKVISQDESLFYSDLPALSPQIEAHLRSLNDRIVIDLGGGQEGSKVLGRYRDFVLRNDHDIFYVINTKRPFNENAREIIYQINSIENSSGVKITGLVNNTHLMYLTDKEMIKDSFKVIDEVCDISGIDLKFTCINNKLFSSFEHSGRMVFPVECYLWPKWLEN